MKQTTLDSPFGPVVRVLSARAQGEAGVEARPGMLVVCEHASNRVPDVLRNLGVSDDVLQSHVAWDPGALAVAQRLARRLGAGLVHGEISRLVFDCNRHPAAPDAMPAQSEIYDIPGNANLTEADKAQRITAVSMPFHAALAAEVAAGQSTLDLLITVHSFNPTYQGQPRTVEIGLLHGQDAGFATSMMDAVPGGWAYDTRLNEPYSAADGVSHTLDLHGTSNGIENVMIELRNDLIATPDQQDAMAEDLANWILATRNSEPAS